MDSNFGKDKIKLCIKTCRVPVRVFKYRKPNDPFRYTKKETVVLDWTKQQRVRSKQTTIVVLSNIINMVKKDIFGMMITMNTTNAIRLMRENFCFLIVMTMELHWDWEWQMETIMEGMEKEEIYVVVF